MSWDKFTEQRNLASETIEQQSTGEILQIINRVYFQNRFIKRFMSLLPTSIALKITKYIISKGLKAGNW